METTEATKDSLPGLRRGLQVLEWLGNNPERGSFSQISDVLNIAVPSTVTRIIKTLLDDDFITKNKRCYQLSAKAQYFGAALAGLTNKKAILQRAVEELRDLSHESSSFFSFESSQSVLLAKSESPDGIHQMDIGMTNPKLLSHPWGLLALIHNNIDISSLYPNQDLSKVTPLLKKIRKQGYFAGAQTDRPELFRVVYPVLLNQEYIGAIGLSCFNHNITAEKIKTFRSQTQACAQKIVLQLERIQHQTKSSKETSHEPSP